MAAGGQSWRNTLRQADFSASASSSLVTGVLSASSLVECSESCSAEKSAFAASSLAFATLR